MPEGHPHGHDTWPDTAAGGYPVADDGAAYRIHDEPDVRFNAADLDVSLIRHKSGAGMVVVMVNEGLYTSGGNLTVVGNLLVADPEAIEIHEGL